MDHKKALLVICAVALLIRLVLVFQTQTLNYEAYETVRQVKHIQDTGLPLIKDELSYGGRTNIPLPVFPYIIAFSTLILPSNLAFIIIPNLLAVLLHAALFYLILELTNDTRISLLGAAASIFSPVYLQATLLTLSSLSIALPLIILIITLFLKLRKSKEKRNILLFLFIVLSFTHPLAALFIPFLILSMALITIKQAKGERAQQEFAIFAIFYLIWFNILLYKNSLAAIGVRTLTGNTPAAALPMNITIVAITAAIGIIPFGLALYTTYKEAASQHIGILTTISLAITTALIMAFGFLPLITGAALLSAVCFTLAAVGIQQLYQYSKTLRRRSIAYSVTIGLATLFILTTALPTVLAGIEAVQETADPAIIAAASWLKENSLPTSLVLAAPEQGFVIEAIAERPTYLDEHYLNTPDASQRYAIAQAVINNTNVATLVQEAHIDYIMSKERITEPCVNTIYTNGTYIAKVLCS